jgi:cellulose synthase/poly-beta-1,6-N-acetylglucosamine synthase-like glycosyltransferase
MNTFIEITYYTSIVVVSLYVLLNVVTALFVRRDKPVKAYDRKLTILIAARNEQRAILDTLASIEAMDYPKNLLEVIVGDDRSTDRTAELVMGYIEDKPHFRYHYCDHQYPNVFAKQNVLAQLSKLASHDLILHTDADIRVAKDWAALHAGVYDEKSKVGMASGITTVDDASTFARLQALDWLQALCTVNFLNQNNVPLTALGNNLSMTAEAYKATGGYENLPFCITEDLMMHRAVLAKGYKMRWIWHPDGLNRTRAPESLRTYLNQRKRWYKGGMQFSPWYAHIFFSIHASCYPILVISTLVGGLGWGLLGKLMLAKVGADYTLLTRACRDMKRTSLIPYLPVFTLYNFFIVFVMILYFPLPSRYSWKGRRFS